MAIKIEKKKKVSEMIVDELISQIRRGDLKVGDKLPNERLLSESLGVSRMPLREAIHALGQAGILETRHGEGTFVSRFNPEQLGKSLYWISLLNSGTMLELTETRKLLEVECARLACLKATSEEIEEIRDAMYEREKWVAIVFDEGRKDMRPRLFAAGQRFHEAIDEASHNDIYINLLKAIRASSDLYQEITATFHGSPHQTTAEHRAIYKAISERDTHAAIMATSTHHDHTVDAIKEYIRNTEHTEVE